MNFGSKQAGVPPQKLHALVGLRVDLVDMAMTLKTHLDSQNRSFCKERVENYLAFLQKSIDELTADIVALVKQDVATSKRAEIIASLPGVDFAIASILAVDMPWLGKMETKKTAGPAGISPYTKDSGMYVTGDRAMQRRELYAAAVHASKKNEKIKAFYDKQLKDGKTVDEALISVMFKLIVVINSMLKRGTKWVEAVDSK